MNISFNFSCKCRSLFGCKKIELFVLQVRIVIVKLCLIAERMAAALHHLLAVCLLVGFLFLRHAAVVYGYTV